jgi:type I restriction enzyme, S subunit
VGEWRIQSLGALTENYDSIRVPVKELDRRSGPYPYFGASGIVDYVDKYLFDGEYLLVAEDGENLRTRTTPVAFLARGQFWVNNHAHIVRGNKNADTRFLMYALMAADIGGYLTGSTMPKLTQGNMNRIPIAAPPLEEQRAIADILGSLDDKIELNRRMNETLEAIARALFKSWFVYFDPIRGKGHDLYLRYNIDEVGSDAIPTGWRREPLLHHARLISGGTPKTDIGEYWNGDIQWASAKDVSQCTDPFLVFTERTITERGLLESATRLVPKLSTVVVARGATTGRFCLLGHDMAMNQTCYALQSAKGRPFWLATAFAYLVDGLVHAAHGSVFDTITTRTLESASVVVAPDEIMDEFEANVASIYHRILINCEQSRALGEIRDLLLPKLISGELRVKEAERIVAEAAA